MATCGDISGRLNEPRVDVESAVADALGNVEVLKVKHHGSHSSSNQLFLDTLQPSVSIISVGQNTNDHPAASKQEMDRLQPSSVVVLGGTATVSDAAATGSTIC